MSSRLSIVILLLTSVASVLPMGVSHAQYLSQSRLGPELHATDPAPWVIDLRAGTLPDSLRPIHPVERLAGGANGVLGGALTGWAAWALFTLGHTEGDPELRRDLMQLGAATGLLLGLWCGFRSEELDLDCEQSRPRAQPVLGRQPRAPARDAAPQGGRRDQCGARDLLLAATGAPRRFLPVGSPCSRSSRPTRSRTRCATP